jgi:hypothetical protein
MPPEQAVLFVFRLNTGKCWGNVGRKRIEGVR